MNDEIERLLNEITDFLNGNAAPPDAPPTPEEGEDLLNEQVASRYTQMLRMRLKIASLVLDMDVDLNLVQRTLRRLACMLRADAQLRRTS